MSSTVYPTRTTEVSYPSDASIITVRVVSAFVTTPGAQYSDTVVLTTLTAPPLQATSTGTIGGP